MNLNPSAAAAEAAQLRRVLAIAGRFKVSGKPTPSKTNFESRSV
jgi:hypothetical protein